MILGSSGQIVADNGDFSMTLGGFFKTFTICQRYSLGFHAFPWLSLALITDYVGFTEFHFMLVECRNDCNRAPVFFAG